MPLMMEQVVQDVEVRKITVQGQERTIYDVIDSTGTKWTAWEQPLAERAFAMKGQPAVWKVDVVQKNNFTNRTLKDIQSANGSGAPQTTTTPTFPSQPALPASFQPSTASTAFAPPAPDTITFKDRLIFRQTACKVAAQISTSQDEFRSNVAELVEFFTTGEWPYRVGDIAKQLQADEMVERAEAAKEDDLPF